MVVILESTHDPRKKKTTLMGWQMKSWIQFITNLGKLERDKKTLCFLPRQLRQVDCRL